MKFNVSELFFKTLRGDHISRRMWKYTLLAALLGFVMVYSSVSMDQKVYRLRKLKDQLAVLQTEYVELQTDLSRLRMESNMLEVFRQKGLIISPEPFTVIRVE